MSKKLLCATTAVMLISTGASAQQLSPSSERALERGRVMRVEQQRASIFNPAPLTNMPKPSNGPHGYSGPETFPNTEAGVKDRQFWERKREIDRQNDAQQELGRQQAIAREQARQEQACKEPEINPHSPDSVLNFGAAFAIQI
jgi:hypothetical protein